MIFLKIKFQSKIDFVQKSIDLLIFFNRGAFGFASSAKKNHQPRATSEAKKWRTRPQKKATKAAFRNSTKNVGT